MAKPYMPMSMNPAWPMFSRPGEAKVEVQADGRE